MYKKITYMLLVFLIGACSSTPTIQTSTYEQLQSDATQLSKKLNVNVIELNDGLPKDVTNFNQDGIWPELRRAESRKFAVNIKNTLDKTDAFGNVSVTSSPNFYTDITLKGKIIKSNGEDLHLDITVTDSTGHQLVKKTYRHRTYEYFFENIRNKDIDPFDPLYRSIASDIINALKLKDLDVIENITNLRFANNLNASYFNDSIEIKNDRYVEKFIPASNDPMFIRSQNVQLKDMMFRNEMQNHYINFAEKMDDSYKVWQEAAFKASKQKREAEAAAAAQAVLGALLVAAAASSASSSDYDYSTSSIVAASVGAGLLVGAVVNSQEAKVHENTINEVSKSFDGEIAPKVVEMEGLQVKLEGSIDEQFTKWQNVLRTIYESESSQTKEFEIL